MFGEEGSGVFKIGWESWGHGGPRPHRVQGEVLQPISDSGEEGNLPAPLSEPVALVPKTLVPGPLQLLSVTAQICLGQSIRIQCSY